ncbi:uncharacterized protein LOC118477987 [Aplysia californica]|uniref:Uncharacterized protein LOC118477987 n=1 Tax=Aplysia californica TaxID=6500 RepID=A0ABM1VWB1_APLCA|nr:uncharacterized protein LOC118477987 [Aplysia californica]
MKVSYTVCSFSPFQFIVLQLDVNAEMTMNFSGIPQLTDYTFALMAELRKTEKVRLNSVRRIVLDGCHLITDAALRWMSQTFPSLEGVSLAGCYKITEAGLVALSKGCPKLISNDLSSTNVMLLPRSWLPGDGMKMTCCPVLYPVEGDERKKLKAEPVKAESSDLVQVCILRKPSHTCSLLHAIRDEKQTPSPSQLAVEHNVALTSDLKAAVLEAPQSLFKLLVTDRTVVVLPSELKDKSKIHEEAATAAGLIIEVLGEHPHTQFVLAGCSTDAAGIVPTDLVRAELEQYLKKLATLINETNYPLV